MTINHGANLYDLSNKLGFDKKELLDFSSNINPLGSSNLAKKTIIDNIDMVSIYPDPSYSKLKQSISNYCNCLRENIILGSGATELISSFINIVSPKKSVLVSPSYSEYEKELNKAGCNIVKYFALEENNFEINTSEFVNFLNKDNYELVVICNPNNPTGFTFSKNDIAYILENTNAFVMVDETYIEFTDRTIFSSTTLVDKFKNLFVIRGTSKFFGTPGIRLGYGLISNNDVKIALEKKLDLWNINIFASLMGEVMFEDKEFIENSSLILNAQRDYLHHELSSIEGIKVYYTQGNFILCKIKSKKFTAKDLRESLIRDKIIIRDCNSFEGLDEYFFRVCILTPKANEFLIKKLRDKFIS
ncbi:MAG: pyridoxal phosphate-dependent aminotransferase [Paraclostridium sp.]